mmetsp:Transcript_3735/g.10587  ORF Transcript_3735/g.10587 Transcript_3735/m.10587 type:complete len:208 (+) Transcript_3735:2247-2870(+)
MIVASIRLDRLSERLQVIHKVVPHPSSPFRNPARLGNRDKCIRHLVKGSRLQRHYRHDPFGFLVAAAAVAVATIVVTLHQTPPHVRRGGRANIAEILGKNHRGPCDLQPLLDQWICRGYLGGGRQWSDGFFALLGPNRAHRSCSGGCRSGRRLLHGEVDVGLRGDRQAALRQHERPPTLSCYRIGLSVPRIENVGKDRFALVGNADD